MIRPIDFHTAALATIRTLPIPARREIAHQLARLQFRFEPTIAHRSTESEVGPGNYAMWSANGICVHYGIVAEAIHVSHAAKKQDDIAVADMRRRVSRPDDWRNFRSVWFALENSKLDATNMKLRSDMMIALADASARNPHHDSAKWFGITLAAAEALKDGRFNEFDIGELIAMSATAGLELEMLVVGAADHL